MSIASRISQIEQHLTGDYSVLELAGADLTNVDKNIQNLKEQWQKRLLYFLNNGTNVIWNNWNKVTGKGTSIKLNNTLEANMKIELEGNTYQETTTGANLQKYSVRSSGIYNCASDGQITINGTPSSGISYAINQSGNEMALESGTYVVKVIGTLGGIADFIMNVDGTTTGYRLNSNNEFTFTLSSNANVRTLVNAIANTTYNANFYVTLAKNTATTERYTNGASPNPQYPQDVDVVTGDNTIVVSNKNLFDVTAFENQLVTGKILNDSGVEVADVSSTYSKYMIPVKANTTYYRKGAWQRMYVYDKNKTLLSRGSGVSGFNSSFTVEQDGYIGFQISNSYWASNKGQEQIEIGSQATTYIAHQGQEYTLNLGKNLVGTLYQGGIDLGGSGGTTGALNRIRTNFIKIDANSQYTISNEDTIVNQFGLGFYDKDRAFIGAYSSGGWVSIGTGVSITPIANAKYIMVAFRNSSNDNITPDLEYKIQIEKGAKTSYSPYFTPIELCKIGTYKDYLYKSGDKWYKHTEIGKVVFNGQETQWGLWFSTPGAFSCNNYIRSIDSSSTINCICDYYSNAYTRSYIRSNLANVDNVCATNGGELVLVNKTYATKEDFKTWLTTHNVTVYTILETPTETEITNSELINQLDSLLGAMSYLDQTNVNQENNNLASILNATALEEIS